MTKPDEPEQFTPPDTMPVWRCTRCGRTKLYGFGVHYYLGKRHAEPTKYIYKLAPDDRA